MKIKLKPDKKLRDQFFTPDSYSHPAKGHLGMWWEIMERYTQEGGWILDPMAGIGATLIGALMGRNVICVELEQHFIDPMLASWGKMRQKPMLGHTLGQVLILRGDARALPLGSVDGVVTSPPYEGIADSKRHPGDHLASLKGHVLGYTKVEAIVTSPPYEQADSHKQDPRARATATAKQGGVSWTAATQGAQNIGNLRGAAYWEAMTAVYREAYRVLRPNGVMVLVLKGFTRDGKYIDLPLQTKDLVETLGFTMFDTWQREVWNLSFWRQLQSTDAVEKVIAKTKGMFDMAVLEIKKMMRISNGKLDNRLRFEEVLAFRKDGDGGSGIEAVITSPPYEGSIQGEPGIDWTKVDGGKRDRTKEPRIDSIKAGLSGYTRQEKP